MPKQLQRSIVLSIAILFSMLSLQASHAADQMTVFDGQENQEIFKKKSTPKSSLQKKDNDTKKAVLRRIG